jgi:hypothetical protein
LAVAVDSIEIRDNSLQHRDKEKVVLLQSMEEGNTPHDSFNEDAVDTEKASLLQDSKQSEKHISTPKLGIFL